MVATAAWSFVCSPSPSMHSIPRCANAAPPVNSRVLSSPVFFLHCYYCPRSSGIMHASVPNKDRLLLRKLQWCWYISHYGAGWCRSVRQSPIVFLRSRVIPIPLCAFLVIRNVSHVQIRRQVGSCRRNVRPV